MEKGTRGDVGTFVEVTSEQVELGKKDREGHAHTQRHGHTTHIQRERERDREGERQKREQEQERERPPNKYSCCLMTAMA